MVGDEEFDIQSLQSRIQVIPYSPDSRSSPDSPLVPWILDKSHPDGSTAPEPVPLKVNQGDSYIWPIDQNTRVTFSPQPGTRLLSLQLSRPSEKRNLQLTIDPNQPLLLVSGPEPQNSWDLKVVSTAGHEIQTPLYRQYPSPFGGHASLLGPLIHGHNWHNTPAQNQALYTRDIPRLVHAANYRLDMQKRQNMPPDEASRRPDPATEAALRQQITQLALAPPDLGENVNQGHRKWIPVTDASPGYVGMFQWGAYGQALKAASDTAYRAYLMVEPGDMPPAVALLRSIGQRVARHELAFPGLRFKWLTKLIPKSLPVDKLVAELYKPEYGDYPGLNDSDPRICIYFDSPDEQEAFIKYFIHNHLDALRVWSKNRIQPNGTWKSRRPGTSTRFDPENGAELRVLCYNDQPGYSEHEAEDPDWRDTKMGSPTTNL